MDQDAAERIAKLEITVQHLSQKNEKLEATLHGRIKSEGGHIKEYIDTRLEAYDTQQQENMKDIKNLKAWKNWMFGAGATIGGLISLGALDLWKKFTEN